MQEQQRIEAVNRFKHLGEGITKELNDIVRLTAQICNTPIAMVTLLHNEEQFVKASVGFDAAQTNIDIAFCRQTISHDEILMLNNKAHDKGYSNNLFSANISIIKFYGGCKLITNDGFAVGSLSVIDSVERILTDEQLNALTVLARQVIQLMELHYSLQSLVSQHEETQSQKLFIEDSEIKLKAIFDSSKDTHILVDKNLQVLAFNKSAAVFASTVYNKQLVVGDTITDYADMHLVKQFIKYIAVALSGKPVKREWMLKPGTPLECWKETSFIPVKNREGEIIGIALNSTDITTRKRQAQQIEIQNEALTRIAIIQSHELRRPVASLLGIINLIKMEQLDFGYLNILEVTINELDEKIRGIVKDSEDTIQVSHLSIVA
jgi:PAS domain S-box-containing protein